MKGKLSKVKLAARTALLTSGFMALTMSVPVTNEHSFHQRFGVIEAQAASTFSKYWFQDEVGNWKVRDPKGNIVTNAWLCDDAVEANGKDVWYLLDGTGNMITAGLVQDGTGNLYSLETNHNGYFGMLRYNSGNYDGINLVLDSQHNGSFAKILNADGLEALKAKYGIILVTINNNNCVYTSQFAAQEGISLGKPTALGGGGGSSSGGGGGGGSSSGGGGGGGSSNSSAKKDKAVKNVVTRFVDEYITEDMTDFEKEMMIIQYMAENIEYDWENYINDTIPKDSYSEYGALVKGIAVCDGYADAFMQLAEACDLTVNKVIGTANGYGGWSGHAWNQIKLDGEWYHVDVTWEDTDSMNSIGTNLGFDQLSNRYINVTDKYLSVDHKWDKSTYKCSGEEYDSLTVLWYMMTGETDSEMRGDRWRRYLLTVDNTSISKKKYRLASYGCKMDDNSNYFTGENIEECIAEYIDQMIADGYQKTFAVASDTDLSWLTVDWLRENIGGRDGDAVRSSGWYLDSGKRRDEGYFYVVMKNSYNETPLLTQKQSRELLEEALEEEDINLIATEEQLNAYIAKLSNEKPMECMVVYDDESELFYASEWNINKTDLNRPVRKARHYIAVEGHPYTICEYELTYKDFSEMFNGKLKEDNSNLFTESGDTLLSYLKDILELPKEVPSRTEYIVMKGENYADPLMLDSQIRTYVKDNCSEIICEKLQFSRTKKLILEETPYTIYTLRIPYYCTVDELLGLLNITQLESDRSNFIENAGYEKGINHLLKMLSDGKKVAHIVSYVDLTETDPDEHAETIAKIANMGFEETHFYWDLVEAKPYYKGYLKDGEMYLYKYELLDSRCD